MELILWIKILIIFHLLWIFLCLTKCGCNNLPDMNDIYRDPMFNPMLQYEQAYCYYRYLCMQMDYKIKCKEYEKLCSSSSNSEKSQRRVE